MDAKTATQIVQDIAAQVKKMTGIARAEGNLAIQEARWALHQGRYDVAVTRAKRAL